MKMRTRFLLVVVFLLATSGAGAYTLTDYIHNSSGIPISGAQVRAYERFTFRFLTSDTTDVNGQYDLTVSDSVTLITVCVNNYLSGMPEYSRCFDTMKPVAGSTIIPGNLGVRGLAADSSTVGVSSMGSLSVTGARPRMFGVEGSRDQSINLNNPRIASFIFLWGFPWQYQAAESLWMDGFKAAFAIAPDSVGFSGVEHNGTYLTWNQIREIQNMGHEIWLYGGMAAYGLGGATRYSAYTVAQLDTAISNAKTKFATEGIRLCGYLWPQGDSASYAKFKTTIRKHFDVASFNPGWNPARPYGDVLVEQDSIDITNIAMLSSGFLWTLAERESMIAVEIGQNHWYINWMIGSPVVNYSFETMGPDVRRLWQWADSLGIQILPPAAVAKQWYNQLWPDFQPITNGDFHIDLDNDGRPDGWYCVDSTGTLVSDHCLYISRTAIGTASVTTRNYYGHLIPPTPDGYTKYAIVYPNTNVCLRGYFTGFKRPAAYAFSFWARNADINPGFLVLDIYRETGIYTFAGSDANRWVYAGVTLPADTLWHKVTYLTKDTWGSVLGGLIMATGDSTQMIRFHILGDIDTTYVTGIEAHPWNGILQPNSFVSADKDTLWVEQPDWSWKGMALH